LKKTFVKKIAWGTEKSVMLRLFQKGAELLSKISKRGKILKEKLIN
jgi:hypothetical protein